MLLGGGAGAEGGPPDCKLFGGGAGAGGGEGGGPPDCKLFTCGAGCGGRFVRATGGGPGGIPLVPGACGGQQQGTTLHSHGF